MNLFTHLVHYQYVKQIRSIDLMVITLSLYIFTYMISTIINNLILAKKDYSNYISNLKTIDKIAEILQRL